MQKKSWRYAMLVASLVLGTVPSVAQEQAEPAPDTGPTWLATCSNQTDADALSCSMTQTLSMANSGQRLLSVTVQPEGETPSILLSLPHGLNLQEGVGFSTDDGQVDQFAFTTADVNGIYARVSLTSDRLTVLRSAKLLKLSVVGVGGRTLNFDVSLAGFSNTYDLIN